MLEQRLQPRVQVSKAAKIALDNGTKIECVVVNRSSGGVCIEVDSPTRIPESFALTMGTDDLNRACRVRWRLGKRLGLAFE
jgi:PilZ domain